MAPRTAQKNRTRNELLATARQLMARGEDVTLARVAEEANINRATVYRYFSDPGVLAADAALDIEVATTASLVEGIADVRDRVHNVANYYLQFTRDHEGQFRQFLSRTIRLHGKEAQIKMRGARRIDAFAEALIPVKAKMNKKEFADLTLRLSMTTGIEQHIILDDVLKVDHATGDDLQIGLVDALLDKYLPQA